MPPQKPNGPADEYCPLWKRPCNKVCATCKFWKPVEFTARHPQTGEFQEQRWDCSLAWNVVLDLDTGRRMERLAAEQSELRKAFTNLSASIGAAMHSIATVALNRADALAKPAEPSLKLEDAKDATSEK